VELTAQTVAAAMAWELSYRLRLLGSHQSNNNNNKKVLLDEWMKERTNGWRGVAMNEVINN